MKRTKRTLLISVLGAMLLGPWITAGMWAQEREKKSADIIPPEGMAYIADSTFLMGSTGREGKIGFQIGVDELPQHKVHVKHFFMDRFEVTNDQYKNFLEVTGRPTPADPHEPLYYSWTGNNPPPGQENHPVIYVSWHDADTYCHQEGKRLPTEAEWERAAKGADNRQWPWGNIFNTEMAGEICNVYESDMPWTTPVGSYPKGVSAEGIHDLCGNVAEWTSDWYQVYPGSKLKRSAFGELFKVARGGAWVLPIEPWSRTSNRNLAQPLDYRHRSLGFRCVKDL